MHATVDLFPADVTVGETLYRQSRLIVTEDEVFLFGVRDGRPALLASAARTGEVSDRRVLRSVPVEDGTWEVNRGQGCGCHSPLKRANRMDLLASAAQ